MQKIKPQTYRKQSGECRRGSVKCTNHMGQSLNKQKAERTAQPKHSLECCLGRGRKLRMGSSFKAACPTGTRAGEISEE